ARLLCVTSSSGASSMIPVPFFLSKEWPTHIAATDVRAVRGYLLIASCASWLTVTVVIASALLASPSARADALQIFAQQCDEAIGATVPDFDCDAGTDVPVTHPTPGPNNTVAQCDRP